MQDSVNKFENFSVEVLLDIFDYLSIDDCFQAFYSLNSHLNSALQSAGFTIDLTSISSQTYTQFYQQIIFPTYFHQIRQLKLSNDLTIGLLERFFTDFNLRDFTQLRSLILIKPSYTTLHTLALFIPQLKQLEYLSIDANSYPEHFFESVTTKSISMKSCYLPGLEIEDELTFQSSKIEYLTITVEDITILFNLLAVFTQLKYLQVTVRSALYLDETILPKVNLIICANLQIFHLYVLQRSYIDFDEIEYFFRHIEFYCLTSLSYNCATNSLNHLHVSRWNAILSKYHSTLEKLNFFVQIPSNAYSYKDIQDIRHDLQTNLTYSIPISLSISSSYYIIHTNIYPKHHFDISLKLSDSDQYLDYDPIHCQTKHKYSKVNSLTLDSQSILPCTILPQTIRHLHIQGSNNDVKFNYCLENCADQLLLLKIFGLPNDLPSMLNLRQLTIQQVMFSLKMARRLAILCPCLELLTIEIDCIDQFQEIVDQLRYQSNLSHLKFIRAFSRDSTRTWTSWLNESNQLGDNINYEARNSFLFLWF